MFWSNEEVEYIKAHYSNTRSKDMLNDMKRLFGTDRKPRQLEGIVSKLGLKKEIPAKGRIWSNDEVEFVKKQYQVMQVKDLIAAFQERYGVLLEENELRSKINRLGLKKSKDFHSYTKEQDEYLKIWENYDGCLCDLVDDFNTEFGTSLNECQISHRVKRLNIKNKYHNEKREWSDIEKEYVRNYYHKMNSYKLEELMQKELGSNKSNQQILKMAYKLGLEKKGRNSECYRTHEFTYEEIDFFLENWPVMPNALFLEMFEDYFNVHLERHHFEYLARCIYNIEKENKRHQYSPEELEYFKEMYLNACDYNQEFIAKEFNKKFDANINKNCVNNLARKLNIVMPEKTKEFEIEHTRKAVALTTHPVGHESLLSRDVLKVKTENGWIPKGRLVWQQHNGEIPHKHIVIHLDGDTTNNNIENLRVIDNNYRGLLLGNNAWGLGRITEGYLKYFDLCKTISKLEGEE